ncbi:hypothetical protein ABH920_010057 [Catenulispora sp. EB89]|uniref:hypothetical protein n=1 Tax=Catenulispora sp. EB89 TaxID=3156257 RepID=UPI003518CF7A
MALTYEWDEETVSALKQALDEGLDSYDTAARMIVLVGPEPPAHVACLVSALQYQQTSRPDLKDAAARVYAPMFEIGGHSHPESAGEATESTLLAWADALELLVAYPLAVSRLADLLWLRRFGPKHYLHARAAHQAFRALWTYPGIAEVDRTECLTRALDLTTEAGMKPQVIETVTEIVSTATQILADPQPAPGSVLRLLTRLAALPVNERHPELADLVDNAGVAFSADPFIFDAVMQIRLKLSGADAEARRAVAAEIVESWEQAARGAEPLAAIRHLEQALAMARTVGLREETQRLLLHLQELSRGDLGLREFSAGVDIPFELAEAFVRWFLEGDDPLLWLNKLGNYCPVEQDRDAVAEHVRAAMKEAPFYYLATHIKLNEQGLPIKIISGDDDRFAQAVLDHHTHRISIWGQFAAEILSRVTADARTSPEAIAEFLAGGLFDEALSEGLVRAFGHFAAGRYEETLLCTLPRLEAALRSASMNLGLVVYTEPGVSRSGLGSFIGLGELLSGLKGFVPEAERIYLTMLLAAPLSVNLRNRALHGLMQYVSKRDAALALHAAATIALWRSSAGEDLNQDDG